MRISSPGTQKNPGNSPFQLLLKCLPISSYSRKKGVILGGAQNTIPGWSMHYIKHECTTRSGLWAAIFSYFHSTQWCQGRLQVPELCSSVSVDFPFVHAVVGFVLQLSIEYWKTATNLM